MSRERSLSCRGDRGTTLVEMLVSMVLLTIVTGIATSAFIVVMQNYRVNTERTEAQASNRVGLERMLRLIRESTYPQRADWSQSTIVLEAETDRMVFAAHASSDPNAPVSRVVIEQNVADGTVRMGVSNPTCPADPNEACTYTTPVAKQVVASYVRNGVASACRNEPADHAFFRYYAAAPDLGALVEITPSVTGQPLEGVRLKDVASVRIEMYADKLPGKTAPDCELLSGTVKLRNWRGQ
jgi:prepilin-type N-terminal cleavage/methylation domain-containing protein